MAEEDKKEENTQEDISETVENEVQDEAVDETELLRSRVAELETEVADLKDKILREAAETENYKKRLRVEKENAVKYANESLIRDLLDPIDNLSRAIEAAEKSQDTESIKTGVTMVEDQLKNILKTNWGLEQFSPDDEPFNPSEMEACMVQEVENLDNEKVIQVFMKGYKLHGKVIRSAKVVVGKPKSN